MTSTSPRWVCSGEQVGTFYVQTDGPCSFVTDSQTDAFSHFEQTGHAVDPVETDMQAAHDSGQHADGLPRGICAACDFPHGDGCDNVACGICYELTGEGLY